SGVGLQEQGVVVGGDLISMPLFGNQLAARRLDPTDQAARAVVLVDVVNVDLVAGLGRISFARRTDEDAAVSFRRVHTKLEPQDEIGKRSRVTQPAIGARTRPQSAVGRL